MKSTVNSGATAWAAIRRPLTCLVMWLVSLGATSAPALAQSAFTLLSPLGGYDSAASAINNAGQVVGFSSSGESGDILATAWSAGAPSSLSFLQGGTNAGAAAINDHGQIAGWSNTASSRAAVVWNGSAPTQLGMPTGWHSAATDINNTGQVVGFVGTPGAVTTVHAAVWNDTTPTLLGTLGGTLATANGINDAGWIVGWSSRPGDSGVQAALWRDGTVVGLDSLGGTWSAAEDVNEAGVIVGYSTLNDASHAVMWEGNRMIELGTLGGSVGIARGLNNSGLIVGASTVTDGTLHAVLWRGTSITDLNSFLDAATLDAGWLLEDASDINDRGWIAGTAYNTLTNERRGYVLAMAPVPEPATYALMLAGLMVGMMATHRHRSRRGLRAP